MEGDSASNASVFLGLGAIILLYTMDRPPKWAELAANLLILSGLALPLFGYDPRIGWSLLEEASIAICATAIIYALTRYARRELAEGEYDLTRQ